MPKKKKEERKKRARSLIILNVVLSFIQVGLNELGKNSQPTKKEKQQMEKINRWLQESWNTVKLPAFTSTHKREAGKLIASIEEVLTKEWKKANLNDSFGVYISLWLMISMLLDDAIILLLGSPTKEWKYLQTTVATWTIMLMRQCKEREHAEEVGGKIQLQAWDKLFKNKDEYQKIKIKE